MPGIWACLQPQGTPADATAGVDDDREENCQTGPYHLEHATAADDDERGEKRNERTSEEASSSSSSSSSSWICVRKPSSAGGSELIHRRPAPSPHLLFLLLLLQQLVDAHQNIHRLFHHMQHRSIEGPLCCPSFACGSATSSRGAGRFPELAVVSARRPSFFAPAATLS